MSDKINDFNIIQLIPRLGDIYSDFTLTFSDPIRSISVKAHRNVLAWLVPYFDKLFTFADNLQKKEFNITVEDAAVAELFIQSLYGQRIDFTSGCYRDRDFLCCSLEHKKSTFCYNFLHLCKLRSYFCLDVDLKKLYQVKVTEENFDLFLQVVNLPEIELNRRLIRTIKRNLPKDYEWEGINEEFKQEVMRKNTNV